MAHGKIKKVIAERGFGFIETEDGRDLFFHVSELPGDAAERKRLLEKLSKGQVVSYREAKGPRGALATEVELGGSSASPKPLDGSYAMTRNSTEEFSRRVRKNLDFIIVQRRLGSDVHEVTQLTVSLLGLIVFPWEAYTLQRLEDQSLEDLQNDGWPKWDIVLDRNGETTTLGKLTYHLRNAAAHRRITFSSDDSDMNNVTIEFKDALPKQPVDWVVRIQASDLKSFCDCFSRLLEAMVG